MKYLLPNCDDPAKLPVWPPDAFGVCASILLRAGAYLSCVDKAKSHNWQRKIEKLGKKWRHDCILGRAPKTVAGWWRTAIKNRNLPLSQIQNTEVCAALLNIVAAADEASEGIGIDAKTQDPFLKKALDLLVLVNNQTSLCERIHWSRVSVLPKLHTPQSGLTIRSLSHHLALIEAGEIRPRWNLVNRLDEFAAKSDAKNRYVHSLNLLLFPWPKYVAPSHFGCAEAVSGGGGRHGYFTYKVRGGEPLDTKSIVDLFKKAESMVGNIDGVVFPELALRHGEHIKLHHAISKISPETFLVSGVEKPGRRSGEPPINSWSFIRQFPIGEKAPLRTMEEQAKHHRWRLDKRQIIQYGLGSRLNPELPWWESTTVPQRELIFFVLYPWLTICVLICEDLARQDPVAEVVRAIGPNLVIALLMDGPQLANRWSARYATVLADDPGSSVVTLTSLGMAELSRPPGGEPKRTVALWKDARSGQAIEISLPQGKDAMILCLAPEELNEYTADGRADKGATDYLILSGIHFV